MISPGRAAVRRYAQECCVLSVEEAGPELMRRLASDPAVRTDAHTARILNQPRYAVGYLRWLQKGASYECLESPLPPVPIDYFEYGRDDAGFVPAYSGGVKPHTVANALLAVAAGRKVSGWMWDLSLFDSDPPILTVSSGGNHRTLACYLWGAPDVDASKLTVLDTKAKTDGELNAALLEIEKLTGRTWTIETQQQADEAKRVVLQGDSAITKLASTRQSLSPIKWRL